MSKFLAWAQLPRETAAEFGAFVAFRDAGHSRSYGDVADRGLAAPATVYRWARQHDWVARCRAYDAHMDALRRKDYEELQRDTIREHIRAAQAMRKRAVAALEKVPLAQLTKQPRVALAMLEAAVRIEQTSLGLPSEVVHVKEHGEPNDAYFAALEPSQLLDLGKVALAELEKANQPGVKNG